MSQIINKFLFNKEAALSNLVDIIKSVDGVKSIVASGSYSLDLSDNMSDVDLIIFYDECNPINVKGLNSILCSIGDFKNPIVSQIGDWDPFLNGGAWFVYQGTNIDLYYCNINILEATISNCKQGNISFNDVNMERIVPFGYYNFYLLGMVKKMVSLSDPNGINKYLKKRLRHIQN